MPKRKSVETLKALAIRMIFSSPSLSVFPVRNRLSKLSPQPIFSARSVWDTLWYFIRSAMRSRTVPGKKVFAIAYVPLSSVGFLIYFPLRILASAGFSASAGIIQRLPARCAPVMRPSLQRTFTRRWEMPHFSAASKVDRYFIRIRPPSPKLTLLYSISGIISRHIL